ncbi:hypothetical protein HDU93_008171 [Gonapodya sp. JEL0774]|nr:hypothetical protein HDU93_008171 [Gonapodya sp. JEL0774]
MLAIFYCSLLVGGPFLGLAFLHLNAYGSLPPMYLALSLFLLINVLICLWEMTLFIHRRLIKQQYDDLRKVWGKDKLPRNIFLFEHVDLSDALSMKYWSRVWSTYSLLDPSYSDQTTFGFTVDIGNGFVTFLPTVHLLLSLTVELPPPLSLSPRLLGFTNALFFWQELVGTILYFTSFFLNDRQRGKTIAGMAVVWISNIIWIIGPARTVKRGQRQRLPPQPPLQPVPMHPNTIVLGLDPTNLVDVSTGGPAAENRATRRLNAYKEDMDFSWLESQLVTLKTSDAAGLTSRLEQISEFGEVLLDCYREGASRRGRWSSTIAKPRAPHQIARRFAILGQSEPDGKDFGFVAKRDRDKAKRKERGMRPLDILLAVGDLDVVNMRASYQADMDIRKDAISKAYEEVICHQPPAPYDKLVDLDKLADANREMLEVVIDYLGKRFPTSFMWNTSPDGRRTFANKLRGDEWDLGPGGKDWERPLYVLGLLTQADWIIVMPGTEEPDPDLDGGVAQYRFVSAVNIFTFPGFLQRDRIGRIMSFVHNPVPSYDSVLRKSMNKFFSSGLREGKPINRFNWILTTDCRLWRKDHQSHATSPAYRGDELVHQSQDKTGDQVYYRTERQTLIRLPRTKAVAFGVKSNQHLLRHVVESEGNQFTQALLNVLGGLDNKVKYYKSLTPELYDRIVEFLHKNLATKDSV